MNKNALKALALTCVAVLGALVAPGMAVAGNEPDGIEAYVKAAANTAVVSGGTVGSIVSTTTVMVLSYSGTAADAEIGITVAAGVGTKLSFYAPAATLATDVGNAVGTSASGTFDLAASTVATFGQLCDLINSSTSGYWHCKLVGVTRADSPANILATTKSQVAGVDSLAGSGYQVPVGTNTYVALGITPGANRRVILEGCIANSAGTTFQVYGRKSKFASGVDFYGNVINDATLVWSSLLTANTLTYVPAWTQYNVGPWIEFAPASSAGFTKNAPAKGNLEYDGHAVIKATNYGAANAPQASTNYLQCAWLEK